MVAGLTLFADGSDGRAMYHIRQSTADLGYVL
jgi:hypothetical protein